MLNGEELHRGWTQFTGDTILDWLSKLDQPTTDIEIGGDFKCSSTDVVNSVFDFIGRTVDAK